MKKQTALTVHTAPDLSELKRAKSLFQITQRILDAPAVPPRNRTDEHGRKQGYWVERDTDGNVQEGTYKDGKRHGRWVLRCAHHFGGTVKEGPFVDGKRHGQWVEWRSSCTGETVEKGSFVDGKKHGQWVVRFVSHGGVESDGDAEVVCYENGHEVEC